MFRWSIILFLSFDSDIFFPFLPLAFFIFVPLLCPPSSFFKICAKLGVRARHWQGIGRKGNQGTASILRPIVRNVSKNREHWNSHAYFVQLDRVYPFFGHNNDSTRCQSPVYIFSLRLKAEHWSFGSWCRVFWTSREAARPAFRKKNVHIKFRTRRHCCLTQDVGSADTFFLYKLWRGCSLLRQTVLHLPSTYLTCSSFPFLPLLCWLLALPRTIFDWISDLEGVKVLTNFASFGLPNVRGTLYCPLNT